jgi:hypothetical protein
MTADLQRIIDGVTAELPNVDWEQLRVTHPADDDGLWFSWWRGGPRDEVQIESSSGSCPFLIETTLDNERRWAETPEDAVRTIVSLLSAQVTFPHAE